MRRTNVALCSLKRDYEDPVPPNTWPCFDVFLVDITARGRTSMEKPRKLVEVCIFLSMISTSIRYTVSSRLFYIA